MGRFDQPPPAVTVSRADKRVRCRVVGWDDDVARCEPDRATMEELAILDGTAPVEVSWSTETSLLTVEGTVEGRPDRGVYTIRLVGDVATVQRRDRVRARCGFRCEVAIADGPGVRIADAETIDLSATGVGLRGSLAAEEGTSVVVAIFPPDAPLPLLGGRVAAVVPETQRVGIAFGSALPGDLDKVATLVARLLSQRVVR